MPNNVIISEGKTTNEAIENGLKKLNATKNMVNIKVLENEDKRSFFSILAPRVVKVEMSLKEDIKTSVAENRNNIKRERVPVSSEKLNQAEENVKQFLDEFLTKFADGITYKISKNEFGLEVVIDGEKSTLLIGYRGETLYALQTIISSVANKNSREKISIILDIANYKSKREETLKQLALKIAKTVERTKKPVTLEPMQPYERKIIHSCLQDSSKVKTESIGEEPRRRVVISLK